MKSWQGSLRGAAWEQWGGDCVSLLSNNTETNTSSHKLKCDLFQMHVSAY
jgi:hypothetical protein